MQRVALIDNNDSFTYNIVDYLRRIRGCRFTVIKSHELIVDQIDQYDKLIISPGPGLPDEYPQLFDVFDRYLGKKPMLCICLGHQALARYLGGSLYQLSPVVHGQAHAIKVIKNDDPIFKNLSQAFQVGLYHSWAVDIGALPLSLELLALSSSGVVMAVKHKEYPVYGLQFHPESFITDHGFILLKNFMGLQ